MAKKIREIREIAEDIDSIKEARTIYGMSGIYLNMMMSLSGLDDTHYAETPKSIIGNFLIHSSGWKGAKINKLRKELESLIN